jgi:hypothetical protein
VKSLFDLTGKIILIKPVVVCPTAVETSIFMEGRRKMACNPEAKQAAINFQAMKRMGDPKK